MCNRVDAHPRVKLDCVKCVKYVWFKYPLLILTFLQRESESELFAITFDDILQLVTDLV